MRQQHVDVDDADADSVDDNPIRRPVSADVRMVDVFAGITLLCLLLSCECVGAASERALFAVCERNAATQCAGVLALLLAGWVVWQCMDACSQRRPLACANSLTHARTPVSYTHLTLPTIYSV